MGLTKFPIGDKLRLNSFSFKILLAITCFIASEAYATKRTAIITLSMPGGARQMGMGETGVALSEDPFATYWNPAALAFSPLADEWRLSHPLPKDHKVTSITSRGRQGFLSQSEVWAGSNKGLLHFHNGAWKEYFTVMVEGNLKIPGIVRTFIGSDENLDSLVQVVKDYNQIKTPEDEKFLVELRLPWSLVIQNPVTSLLYEEKTDKLWVGTTKALHRFDFKRFKTFTSEFANPHITAIESQGATIWIGSKEGLYRYRNGKLARRGKVLPVQEVTTLNWNAKDKELYVGFYKGGIARLKPKSKKGEKDRWNLYNEETDGLVDMSPLQITSDVEGHIWVAHAKGLSHFSRKKWEQILFDDNQIYSITSDQDGAIWIGTREGIWLHQPAYTTQKGKIDTQSKRKSDGTVDTEANGNSGDWFHFHTGHGLVNKHIFMIESQNEDIWLATGAGLERFSKAKNQVAVFGEDLLPSLNIPDLFHVMAAFTFPAGEWGTLGGNLNFVSFGSNTLGDNDGPAIASSELVGTGSYGTRLMSNTALGLNFKFIYSNLLSGVAGVQDATTTSYAFDFGLIQRDVLVKGLNFGTMIQNMGPNVFYVYKGDDDPIPLTWKFGVAYEFFNLPEYRLIGLADYNKELVYEYADGSTAPFYEAILTGWTQPGSAGTEDDATLMDNLIEAQLNLGMEFTYANTIALRLGYLKDNPGARHELDFGVGVMASDILQVDFAMINSLDQNNVRNGQTRFSLLFRF